MDASRLAVKVQSRRRSMRTAASSLLELAQGFAMRNQPPGIGVRGHLDQRSRELNARLPFRAGGFESRND